MTDRYEGIDEDEIFAYLKKRQGIIEGVCVSGGEPLLQKDIAGLLSRIKELGYDIKLDTNGSRPRELREIVQAGLCDYVAMDIKNSKEKYPITTASDIDLSSIEESVGFLLSGKVEYEFRTTVTRELHSIEDMRSIGEWIKGARRYYLQSFIDSGNLIGEGMSAYSPEQMQLLCDAVREYVPTASVR